MIVGVGVVTVVKIAAGIALIAKGRQLVARNQEPDEVVVAESEQSNRVALTAQPRSKHWRYLGYGLMAGGSIIVAHQVALLILGGIAAHRLVDALANKLAESESALALANSPGGAGQTLATHRWSSIPET